MGNMDDEETFDPDLPIPRPRNDEDPFHPKRLIDRIKRWWKFLGDPGWHHAGGCPTTHDPPGQY